MTKSIIKGTNKNKMIFTILFNSSYLAKAQAGVSKLKPHDSQSLNSAALFICLSKFFYNLFFFLLQVYYKGLSATFESSKPYWFLANGTIQVTSNASHATVQ